MKKTITIPKMHTSHYTIKGNSFWGSMAITIDHTKKTVTSALLTSEMKTPTIQTNRFLTIKGTVKEWQQQFDNMQQMMGWKLLDTRCSTSYLTS